MFFSLRILGLLAALLGAAALSACGQKGPLFLPVPPKVPPPMLVSPILTDLTEDSFPATIPVAPASVTR